MSRNLGLMLLRGLKTHLPTLFAGELYLSTDIAALFGGIGSNFQLTIPVFNAAGAQQNNTHVVFGSVILSGGSATIALAGNAAFSSATSYATVVSCDTAKRAPYVTQSSGTSLILNSSNGDKIFYLCIGN